jgi:ribose transport system substrate-binding protein
MFTKNQTNPFFQVVRMGAESAARQLGVSLTHYIPTRHDSIPEQLALIDDVIVKRPDAVVFTPVDTRAMVSGVRKLNAAGIPVVNVVDRSESGRFVTFVGASDYELALVTGRHLLQALGGRGNVVILEGTKGSQVSADRVRGFTEAVKQFPQARLLATQPANFQRLQGLQVTENLMQMHPRIEGIMAADAAMAIGAIEALDAAGRKALVVGMNRNREAVEAIKAGRMLATGDYNGFLFGCIATMAAVRDLRKLPVPREVIFRPAVIDRSNYQGADTALDKPECPSWEDAIKG